MALLKAIISFYGSSVAPKGVNSVQYGNEFFMKLFYKFSSVNGPGDVTMFMKIKTYALWGTLIFMILYMLFVKSFLRSLYYPNYSTYGDNELTVQRKLLINYIVTITYFILFALAIIVSHFCSRDPVSLIYLMLIITLYSVLFTFTLGFAMRRTPKDRVLFIIFTICLVALVFMNIFFLR
jgi:hypothetical protein